jgi:hypothetical protein
LGTAGDDIFIFGFVPKLGRRSSRGFSTGSSGGRWNLQVDTKRKGIKIVHKDEDTLWPATPWSKPRNARAIQYSTNVALRTVEIFLSDRRSDTDALRWNMVVSF